ncbi:MAG: GNAT family N-acetyltransferase [Solirubrobacterales bacterium]|nr:GNAT family N-acetyltransferase [Solirubrobacterales bacterium]
MPDAATRLPTKIDLGPVVGRRLRSADLGDLAAMHADPAVMATLGGPRDRATSERYLTDNLAHWERHGFGMYALRERDGGRFVGRAGVRRLRLGDRDEIELAYALCAEDWGRGLAVAACRTLLGLAQRAQLADSLIAITLPSNHRSRRVMEKAGLVFEREVEHVGLPHVLYRRRLAVPAAYRS